MSCTVAAVHARRGEFADTTGRDAQQPRARATSPCTVISLLGMTACAVAWPWQHARDSARLARTRTAPGMTETTTAGVPQHRYGGDGGDGGRRARDDSDRLRVRQRGGIKRRTRDVRSRRMGVSQFGAHWYSRLPAGTNAGVRCRASRRDDAGACLLRLVFLLTDTAGLRYDDPWVDVSPLRCVPRTFPRRCATTRARARYAARPAHASPATDPTCRLIPAALSCPDTRVDVVHGARTVRSWPCRAVVLPGACDAMVDQGDAQRAHRDTAPRERGWLRVVAGSLVRDWSSEAR